MATACMAQQIRAKHNYVPSRPDELAFKKKEVQRNVSTQRPRIGS